MLLQEGEQSDSLNSPKSKYRYAMSEAAVELRKIGSE
jgi:hypothetical protein